MVKPPRFGRGIICLREKMQNDQYLFSFSCFVHVLRREKKIKKYTPINRTNTPKYMFYIFFLCQVILVKKGVSAISKSVRNQYLEFLAETGMTRYEFSKRSGIPESTLWSLAQKEDYDVRESNIRKIAQGMGVPVSDLFDDNSNTVCLEEKSEVWIIKNYRKLSDRRKGSIEGYIKALLEEDGNDKCQSS